MPSRLTSRPILLAAAALVVAAVGALFVLQDGLFRMAARPPGAFAKAPPPPRPDYSTPEAWALRPQNAPAGAWETPWGVDVFFIHPTTAYAGDDWNTAIDEPKSTARLEDIVLPNHAGPFLHAGPVYAPRYRQAALYAEIDVGGEGDDAFLLAYDDVLRAFDEYVARDNRGRGIIIAGVGQGGLHALRLLEDRFQGGALAQRFAAAYIIDAALPADLFGKRISQPLCTEHAQAQCVVAWTGMMSDDGGARRRFQKAAPIWTADGKIETLKGRETVCVNPLSWSASSQLAPSTDHRGAARAMGLAVDPEIIPRTVSARCAAGVLVVDRPAIPDLRRAASWGARYKTPEFNLFYADIAFNAAERSRAASVWLDENGVKPAKPLPPPMMLGPAPIHRPGGVIDPVR